MRRCFLLPSLPPSPSPHSRVFVFPPRRCGSSHRGKRHARDRPATKTGISRRLSRRLIASRATRSKRGTRRLIPGNILISRDPVSLLNHAATSEKPDRLRSLCVNHRTPALSLDSVNVSVCHWRVRVGGEGGGRLLNKICTSGRVLLSTDLISGEKFSSRTGFAADSIAPARNVARRVAPPDFAFPSIPAIPWRRPGLLLFPRISHLPSFSRSLDTGWPKLFVIVAPTSLIMQLFIFTGAF